MFVQIVDAEAYQVAVAADRAWPSRFRRNEVQLDAEPVGELFRVQQAKAEAVYVVRLWCRAQDGRSVCLVICDARREVYRRLTERGRGMTTRLLEAAQDCLLQRTNGLASCEVVFRSSTAGWESDPLDPQKPRERAWLKFAVSSAYQLDWLWSPQRHDRKTALEEIAGALECAPFGGERLGLFSCETAHAKLDLRTEVMHQLQLRMGGWLKLPEEVVRRLTAYPGVVRAESAVQVKLAELKRCAAELTEMAPLRVMSFDIECISATDAFPLAAMPDDHIICIGVYMRTLGRPAEDSCTMLCLGDTAPLPEEDGGEAPPTRLLVYAEERDLLLGFAEVLAESDADLVVGYNTTGFDWRYIRDRVQMLTLQRRRGDVQASLRRLAQPVSLEDAERCVKQGVARELGGACGLAAGLALELLGYTADEQGALRLDAASQPGPPERALTLGDRARCFRLSRRSEEETPPQDQELNSGAAGENTMCLPRMPGRVNLDLWLYLKRDNPADLPDLKLNTVSQHYLGNQKHDLAAKEMFKAYREGPGQRAAVAAYCRQDCKLVLDLLEKLETVTTVWEMAKIACTPPEDILFRGQQIKVYTQLVLTALANNYVVEDRRESEGAEAGGRYEGATVVDPTPGYYREPVFCLDFASLYPSLMRTMNLSPDTLVRDPQLLSGFTNDITVSPGAVHRFVKGSVRVGLLPRILEHLLSERKKAKRAMEEEKDPRRRALLNSKQLALKISANSVYGACGATKGRLSCRECAEATTAAGRDAIAFTCRYVNRLPGYEIIYGDTDSAFMRIPEEHRQAEILTLFAIGEKLAGEVTQAIAELMPGEKVYIKLEFEKVLLNLCLFKKKRYAGICIDDPAKPGKVMAKGLELVRKDACRLTKCGQKQVLDALLHDCDPRRAADVMVAALERLLTIPPGGPFDDLKQSKSLKAEYKNSEGQVHWRVKELMKERELGSEPRVGDRVEFVVIASTSQRVVDKAEDVGYATANQLPPDWLHYMEAIEAPLMRLLEVPLRTSEPELLAAVEARCGALRAQAQQMTIAHGLARKGTSWVWGHRTRDGGTQGKLSFGLKRAEGGAQPSAEPRAVPSAPKKRAKASGPAPAGPPPGQLTLGSLLKASQL